MNFTIFSSASTACFFNDIMTTLEKLWQKDDGKIVIQGNMILKKLLGKEMWYRKTAGTSLFFILGKSTVSVQVYQWMSEHTTAKVNENISASICVYDW